MNGETREQRISNLMRRIADLRRHMEFALDPEQYVWDVAEYNRLSNELDNLLDMPDAHLEEQYDNDMGDME